jgi:hypothetical protein
MTTPTKTGTVQARMIPMSTVPRAAWDRADRIEVGTIIASDVPTASGIAISSDTPVSRKVSKNTGTLTAPPPIPKIPASMPMLAPARTSIPRIGRVKPWVRLRYSSVTRSAFRLALRQGAVLRS